MKTAICYYSRHHGNTRRVLDALAPAGNIDLIDVTQASTASLSSYDCIGLASGIYGFTTHPSVVDFARRQLPQGKPVFLVCTYGGAKGRGTDALAAVAREKNCPVLGEFSCRGYDTFGPFRLVGGIAKGHPNADDLAQARRFYQAITARCTQEAMT